MSTTTMDREETSLDTDSQDGSRNPLGHAMLAAFASMQFALISGFWYKMLGLDKVDWPRFNGHLIAPGASDVTSYVLGYVASTINGFVFALVFIYLVRPLIPVPANRIGNFLVGQLGGVLLSVISLAWWIPANFPEFHVGGFSNNLGSKAIIGIFIWHAAFFFTLTSLLDAFGKRPWRSGRK